MTRLLLIACLLVAACKDPNVNYVTAAPADVIASKPHGESVEE